MTMKKILFALLTGWMAISFTACDDFLTETPSTSVPTEEALVTTQDFQNALNGVYYTLGSYRFLIKTSVFLCGSLWKSFVFMKKFF